MPSLSSQCCVRARMRSWFACPSSAWGGAASCATEGSEVSSPGTRHSVARMVDRERDGGVVDQENMSATRGALPAHDLFGRDYTDTSYEDRGGHRPDLHSIVVRARGLGVSPSCAWGGE